MITAEMIEAGVAELTRTDRKGRYVGDIYRQQVKAIYLAMHSASPTPDTPDAEDTAWSWLEGYADQRYKEAPEDVSYSADQMVDAFIAGGAALQPTLPVPQGEVERLVEKARPLLDCEHRANRPNDRVPGERIVGFVIGEDDIGLGLSEPLFALEALVKLAALTSSNRPTVDRLERVKAALRSHEVIGVAFPDSCCSVWRVQIVGTSTVVGGDHISPEIAEAVCDDLNARAAIEALGSDDSGMIR